LRREFRLAIIVAGITFGGSFIVILFSPGSFLLHPVFEIDPDFFDFPSDEKKITQIIEIKNTGWVQAKNVRISVDATSKIELDRVNCSEKFVQPQEGILENNFEFEMERMSVNLPCDFWFKMPKQEFFVSTILITAENSPAYQWTLDNRKTEPLSSTFVDFLKIASIISIVFAGVAVGIQLLKDLPKSKH